MATSSSCPALSSSMANNSPSSNASLLYKLKISLFDDRWRRVIVPANFSLYGLHIVIQEVFGWESYHLHHFYSSMGEEYGFSEDEDSIPSKKPSKKLKNDRRQQPVENKAGRGRGIFGGHGPRFQFPSFGYSFFADHEEVRDERVYQLYDVFDDENRLLQYEYDFGASWVHVIEFEGVYEDTAQNGEFPSCVDGQGADRLEDHQDENSDGELKPSFRRKKFNRQQAQRKLRKIFAGKWPLKVDNLKLPQCYACTWLNGKKGGCRESSCDGKCCGVCLKSEFIRESCALSTVE